MEELKQLIERESKAVMDLIKTQETLLEVQRTILDGVQKITSDHELRIRMLEDVAREMKAAVSSFATNSEDSKKRMDDHETRVRNLERMMYILVGAYALVSLVMKLGEFFMKMK